MDEMVVEHIGDGLKYACLYWAKHVTVLKLDADVALIVELLHRFLVFDRHLLHWLEVMSILRSMGSAVASLRTVLDWLTVRHSQYSYSC